MKIELVIEFDEEKRGNIPSFLKDLADDFEFKSKFKDFLELGIVVKRYGIEGEVTERPL